MADTGCATCRDLLSEGLNLCVRARQMDAMDRRKATIDASCDPEWVNSERFEAHVARNNIANPHQPIHTRSATVHLWVQDQYDRDLLDWEIKARQHLSGCSSPEGEANG